MTRRPGSRICTPRVKRALDEQDVKSAGENVDKRAHLVVRRDQLLVLGFDPERDQLLTGRLRDIFQPFDRDDFRAQGRLERCLGHRLVIDQHLELDGLLGESPDHERTADLQLILDEDRRTGFKATDRDVFELVPALSEPTPTAVTWICWLRSRRAMTEDCSLHCSRRRRGPRGRRPGCPLGV